MDDGDLRKMVAGPLSEVMPAGRPLIDLYWNLEAAHHAAPPSLFRVQFEWRIDTRRIAGRKHWQRGSDSCKKQAEYHGNLRIYSLSARFVACRAREVQFGA